MKMRRTVVAVFLMVAILTLGVGYAALSDTFTVTTNVNTSAFDPLVGINDTYSVKSGIRNGVSTTYSETTKYTDTDDYAVTVNGLKSGSLVDEITLTVDDYLATQNDEIVIEFNIENQSAFAISSLSAVVNADSSNSTNAFNIATAFGATTLSAKNGTTTLTVTVTLTGDVPETGLDETYTIKVTADTN